MIVKYWSHIILHHSLTADGKTVSCQAIRKYHTQEKGWKDIGYHFVIELVNDEYEILMGRPLDQEGAHCQGMNSVGLGICFVGNFDEQEVPEAQWKRGVILVRGLVHLLNIPVENIRGHHDHSEKSCPGKKFPVGRFRQEVSSLL